ncbi:hypothetical protein RRG08_028985 [Elysia crispata]|uniref:Uncharacterized protein n=1 Tax=Elysia crispata TaxID=231223 RepID=A0AAE1BDC7_9GAST|nr:hypothetical protein RRG08_028985 [Elysia crispata]
MSELLCGEYRFRNGSTRTQLLGSAGYGLKGGCRLHGETPGLSAPVIEHGETRRSSFSPAVPEITLSSSCTDSRASGGRPPMTFGTFHSLLLTNFSLTAVGDNILGYDGDKTSVLGIESVIGQSLLISAARGWS